MKDIRINCDCERKSRPVRELRWLLLVPPSQIGVILHSGELRTDVRRSSDERNPGWNYLVIVTLVGSERTCSQWGIKVSNIQGIPNLTIFNFFGVAGPRGLLTLE